MSPQQIFQIFPLAGGVCLDAAETEAPAERRQLFERFCEIVPREAGTMAKFRACVREIAIEKFGSAPEWAR